MRSTYWFLIKTDCFIFKGLIVVWLGVIIPVTFRYSWHGRKNAKEDDSAMVYKQLTSSTNRCWLWVENNWNHVVSKSHAPLCEIICKQESMITTTIFTAQHYFSTGLKCRNNHIVVRGQLCHSSARYLIFMKRINYIWSKNCPSVLKLLIKNCFMQLYQKHLLHKSVCVTDSVGTLR